MAALGKFEEGSENVKLCRLTYLLCCIAMKTDFLRFIFKKLEMKKQLTIHI